MAEVLGAVTTATKFFFEVLLGLAQLGNSLMCAGQSDINRQLVLQVFLQDHHLHPSHLLPHIHN